MSPLEAETLVESKHRYRVLAFQSRLALFICFVMFVILVVQQYKFNQFNTKVNQVSDSVVQVGNAANMAQQSSDNIRQQISQVINEQINSPEARQQTLLSRQRIINMEYALCKGPCPNAPSSSPSINK